MSCTEGISQEVNSWVTLRQGVTFPRDVPEYYSFPFKSKLVQAGIKYKLGCPKKSKLSDLIGTAQGMLYIYLSEQIKK